MLFAHTHRPAVDAVLILVVLRTTNCSPTARYPSSIAASVWGVAAASEFAIEMRPNLRRATLLGLSSASSSDHSSGSKSGLYIYAYPCGQRFTVQYLAQCDTTSFPTR